MKYREATPILAVAYGRGYLGRHDTNRDSLISPATAIEWSVAGGLGKISCV